MKYLITLLKILGVCVLGGIVDDTDLSSIGTAPVDLETYDISSATRFDVVSCVRRRIDELDYELCKRNEDVAINKVVDGDVVIWESVENHFRESSVIYELEIPVALRIRERGTGNLSFYRRIEEGWKMIPQVEYIEFLRELRGSVPTRSTFGINLRFHNENPNYEVEKITKKEANMYIYSPSRGHKVKFVYDNTRSIWKATEPSQKCISAVAYFKGEAPHLVHLFIADDNFQVNNIFFKLVKGQWKEVTEEQYTESVPELKDNSDRPIPAELDLKTYNYKQFDIKSRSFEDPYIKYIPKDQYRVTRVKYAGEIIWESEDPEIFASSVDFFVEGGPLMARINFNFQYPFYFTVFLKRSRGWEEGDETDAKDRIYVLQTRRNQVLNLINVDKKVVSAIPSTSNGIEYLLISCRKNYDVMAIREGTQEIWTYPGLDKYFANAWLYFYPKRPKLLHFRVRDTYLGHDDLYYLWKYGWWHSISRHDYSEIMKDMVFLTKHGLQHIEVPLSQEMRKQLEMQLSEGEKTKQETQDSEAVKKPLEVQTPRDTSSEDESARERTVDRGFKEKLYSKYGSPDFDPTDDEETLRLIAKLHDEDFYDEAATLTNSIEYLSFPYDLMSVKSSLDGAQPRRRRAISFSHYDPRAFREPKDPYPRPKTPLPPYRQTDADTDSDDDFNRLNLSRSKKYKSTSDIDKELELRGSYSLSQLKEAPSQSSISRSTSESWSSEEITFVPPPTPAPSIASTERTPSPTPPSTHYGSDASESSSSLHTPSPPDSPERPRRRIRQAPPKEEPEKPSKPDSALIPTISALLLISILSVVL